jgi:hypothetical protein
MWRAFVRDLSDEARYYRFMSRLSDLTEAMAVGFSIIEYIGRLVLVAEAFTGASVITIMPRLPAFVACAATPLQRTRRSSRSPSARGWLLANPRRGRRVHLRKDLPTYNQFINVPGRPFGEASQPPEHEGKHLSATRGKPLWPVGHRTPVSIPHPAWL